MSLQYASNAEGGFARTAPRPWTGRPLRLQAPPSAEFAPTHAQEFVDAVASIENIQLDYTIASLAWVDGWLDQWTDGGSDPMAETIVVAGCYVGECLVRDGGCRWADFDEKSQAVLGFPFGIVSPSGALWNPIGKAFKRVDNGDEDNVAYFAHVVTTQKD